MGSDIDGENEGDKFGFGLGISGDGRIVAVGAPLNDGTATTAGHVRIMKYNGTSWEQLGYDIDGEAQNDDSGFFISLSNDGNYCINRCQNNDGDGGNNNDGHVRVYRYRLYTQADDNNSTYYYESRTRNATTQTKPLIITQNTSTAPVVGNYYWTH